MMNVRKFLSLGVTAGLLIVGSAVLVATPAQAAATGTMSPTTDLYPGQDITLTLVDDGTFCDSSVVTDDPPWGAFADILDSEGTQVGGISFYASESYTGTTRTYTLTGVVPWMVNAGTPARGGDFTTAALYCDADKSAPNAGTNANTLAFSMKPVVVSSSRVAPGGTFDVTVSDEEAIWCDGNTGSGFSMGIGLFDPNGSKAPIFIPADVESGAGAKGVGDFTWDNTSATATVTVPASVPEGIYTLFVGCITAGPEYLQPGPGMEYYNFEVKASLPDTGVNASGLSAMGVVAGTTLVALGAGAFLMRRRLLTQR